MPDRDPEVTPEQEAQLRRLLAQARVEEPVPDDIATRLDRVLAQLATEERDPDAAHSVVDLAARRRRRVRTLLAAAAAVVVVGFGVAQLVDADPGGQGDSAAAGSSATSADESPGVVGPESASAAQSEDRSSGAAPPAGATAGGSSDSPADHSLTTTTSAPRPPVRLSEDGFATQAVRLRNRAGVESSTAAVVPGEALSRAEGFVCDSAAWGEGRLLAALYDGVPAVLAYRPVAGETQTVDLLRCGTGEVLRSTVLPVGR